MNEIGQHVNRTRMSRAHVELLQAAGAQICFCCRGVVVNALPGNGRDNRERRCSVRSCRAEAVLPIAQAVREGWVEVVP